MAQQTLSFDDLAVQPQEAGAFDDLAVGGEESTPAEPSANPVVNVGRGFGSGALGVVSGLVGGNAEALGDAAQRDYGKESLMQAALRQAMGVTTLIPNRDPTSTFGKVLGAAQAIGSGRLVPKVENPSTAAEGLSAWGKETQESIDATQKKYFTPPHEDFLASTHEVSDAWNESDGFFDTAWNVGAAIPGMMWDVANQASYTLASFVPIAAEYAVANKLGGMAATRGMTDKKILQGAVTAAEIGVAPKYAGIERALANVQAARAKGATAAATGLGTADISGRMYGEQKRAGEEWDAKKEELLAARELGDPNPKLERFFALNPERPTADLGANFPYALGAGRLMAGGLRPFEGKTQGVLSRAGQNALIFPAAASLERIGNEQAAGWDEESLGKVGDPRLLGEEVISGGLLSLAHSGVSKIGEKGREGQVGLVEALQKQREARTKAEADAAIARALAEKENDPTVAGGKTYLQIAAEKKAEELKIQRELAKEKARKELPLPAEDAKSFGELKVEGARAPTPDADLAKIMRPDVLYVNPAREEQGVDGKKIPGLEGEIYGNAAKMERDARERNALRLERERVEEERRFGQQWAEERPLEEGQNGLPLSLAREQNAGLIGVGEKERTAIEQARPLEGEGELNDLQDLKTWRRLATGESDTFIPEVEKNPALRDVPAGIQRALAERELQRTLAQAEEGRRIEEEQRNRAAVRDGIVEGPEVPRSSDIGFPKVEGVKIGAAPKEEVRAQEAERMAAAQAGETRGTRILKEALSPGDSQIEAFAKNLKNGREAENPRWDNATEEERGRLIENTRVGGDRAKFPFRAKARRWSSFGPEQQAALKAVMEGTEGGIATREEAAALGNFGYEGKDGMGDQWAVENPPTGRAPINGRPELTKNESVRKLVDGEVLPVDRRMLESRSNSLAEREPIGKEALRAELAPSLGGTAAVARMERNGFLQLHSATEEVRPAGQQGWTVDGKGVVHVWDTAKFPEAVVEHEATHVADVEELGDGWRQLIRDIDKQAKAGDARAQAAIDAALKGMDPEAFAKLSPAEKVHLLNREALAYYIENATAAEKTKPTGLLRRIVGEAKAWLRTSEIGQALAKRGVAFKLTDAEALGLARRMVKTGWKIKEWFDAPAKEALQEKIGPMNRNRNLLQQKTGEAKREEPDATWKLMKQVRDELEAVRVKPINETFEEMEAREKKEFALWRKLELLQRMRDAKPKGDGDGPGPKGGGRKVESLAGPSEAEGNVLESRTREEEASPLWRSALQETIASAKQEKATGEQWKGWLKNQPGVKREEMEDIGLEDWLETQKGVVSKDQVEQFVKDGGVQVGEILKDSSGPKAKVIELPNGMFTVEDSTGNRESLFGGQAEYRTREEAQRYADLLSEGEFSEKDRPKFGQYQVPGGQNYRELLVTIPGKAYPGFENITISEADLIGVRLIDNRWQVTDRYGLLARIYDSKEQAIEHADVLAKEVWDETSAKEGYFSSHWAEPNVLVHLRFNERTDADGKRVLFVEEVQSDWHQEGRKKGYTPTEKERDAAAAQIKELRKQQQQYEPGSAEWDAIDEQAAKLGRVASRREGTIPVAPMKSTSTWAMLGMKRAIKWAADNGFDRVAWTPGEVQAERYDLSKQVDSVSYNPETQRLVAKKDGQRVIDEQTVTENKLADYVGKEVAEKLLAQEPNVNGLRTLVGEGLRVGGEGMKGFYDKLLPNELGKWAKKFGGKIERTTVVTNLEYKPEDAKEAGADALKQYGEGQDAWMIDLTPGIKAEAEKGMTLYSRAPGDNEVPSWMRELVGEEAPSSHAAETRKMVAGTAGKKIGEKAMDLLWRRPWAPGGLLGKYGPEAHPAFRRYQALEGRDNTVEENVLKAYDKAVRKAWGEKGRELGGVHQAEVLSALGGKDAAAALEKLPEEMKPIVLAMREDVDRRSTQLIDGEKRLADLFDADVVRMKEQLPRLSGPAAGELEQMIKIAEAKAWSQRQHAKTVEANKGEWLHTSYEMFGQKGWGDRVKKEQPEVYKAAVAELVAEGRTPAEAKNWLENLFTWGEETGSFSEGMKRGALPGKVDVTALLKKDKIPEAIQKVMGIHTDPRMVYAQSVQNVGRMANSLSFQLEIRDAGLRMGWLQHPDVLEGRPEGKYVTLSGGRAMAALDGLQAFKEVDTGLKDLVTLYDWGKVMQPIIKLGQTMKFAKTVGSPLPTGAVNAASDILAMVTTGDIANGGFIRNFARENAGNKEMRNHLAMLGLSSESPFAGAMRDFAKESYFEDLIGEPRSGRALDSTRRGLGVARDKLLEMYNYASDAAKRVGWEAQRAGLAEAEGAKLRARYEGEVGAKEWKDPIYGTVRLVDGEKGWQFENAYGRNVRMDGKTWGTEREARAEAVETLSGWHLDNWAAQRTSDTYMTYSMAGRGSKELARAPGFGGFTGYASEQLRTGVNQFKIMGEDYKAGRTALAYKRAAGLAITTAGLYILQSMIMQELGVTDDERLAFQETRPVYDRNSLWIPVGPDDRGDMQWVNVGRYDIYNGLKGMTTGALNRGIEKAPEAMIEGVMQYGLQFFGFDILGSKVKEALENRGGKIYNTEVDGRLLAGAKFAEHVMSGLYPTMGERGVDLAEAFGADKDAATGKDAGPGMAALAMVGAKPATADAYSMLALAVSDLSTRRAMQVGEMSRRLANPNEISEAEVRDIYERVRRARENSFNDLIEKINLARKMGMGDVEIRRQLRKLEGIKQADLIAVMDGRVPRWRPDSREFLSGMRKRAETRRFGEEERRRIEERRRKVMGWIRMEE